MALLTWTDPITFLPAGVEFDATVSEDLVFTVSPTRSPVEEGVALTDHIQPQPDVVRLEGVVSNSPIGPYTEGDVYGPVVSVLVPATVTTVSKRPTPGRLIGGSLPRKLVPGQLVGGDRAPVHIPLVPPSSLTVPASFVTLPPLPQANGSAFVPALAPNVDVETSAYSTLRSLAPVDRVRKVLEMLRGAQRRGLSIYVSTMWADFPEMVITSVSAPSAPMDSVRFSIELQELRRAEVATTLVRVKKVPVREVRADKTAAGGEIPKDPLNPGDPAETANTVLMSGVEAGSPSAASTSDVPPSFSMLP